MHSTVSAQNLQRENEMSRGHDEQDPSNRATAQAFRPLQARQQASLVQGLLHELDGVSPRILDIDRRCPVSVDRKRPKASAIGTFCRNMRRMGAWENECKVYIREAEQRPALVLMDDADIEMQTVPLDSGADVVNGQGYVMQPVGLFCHSVSTQRTAHPDFATV